MVVETVAFSVPLTTFAAQTGKTVTSDEVTKEVEQLVETIDHEIDVDNQGKFVIDKEKLKSLITDEIVEKMNQFSQENSTGETIVVSKDSLTQDFTQGIQTINAEIENGNLERLENGTLIKSDDDNFYVQGGSTYEKWGWWGMDKYCSTYHGARWVKELKAVASGSNQFANYIPFVKGPAKLYNWYIKSLAYNVDYVNRTTSNGTITSLYWIPSWWCRPQ